MSSDSLVGDKGRCWSHTFESTKLLVAELTRCLGYFKRENTVFNRSHSSEKCDQEDQRCAGTSIVRSKIYDGNRMQWHAPTFGHPVTEPIALNRDKDVRKTHEFKSPLT